MSSRRDFRPPRAATGRRSTPWRARCREPIIAGLARCTREDIELAARALEPAPRHRLHVFLATSAIHRQYKLNMAQEQIISRAVEGVTDRARVLR